MRPYEQKGCSRHGAQMGRSSDEIKGLVHLERVPWVDGDYDPGGAYWGGGPDVSPVWCAWNDEGAAYVRAKDRASAMAKLPGCTFMPPEPATVEHPDEFTRAYVEAMLWSTNDESDDSGGVPMDENYSIEDIEPETMTRIVAACVKFQTENAEHIAGRSEQAGHDFWLTSQGHGCGFWDGDWEEPAASALTKASKLAGETMLYVGANGKICGHE